jgi:hypothetical protein
MTLSTHDALGHARRHGVLSALLLLALLVLGWGALAPIGVGDRSHLIEIKPGTQQRRLAGDINDALPLTVRLTVGVRDVLTVKNQDSVPHYLGARLVKPGKQFRLPFESASQQEFNSSAHFGGKLTVIVEPWPDPGTARLRWRALELVQTIRHY